MTVISDKYDVVIVGGGPAGLSAAMWSIEIGMTVLMLEKEKVFGGQLHWIHNPVENYLGLNAANGIEVLKQFERSIENRKIDRITGADVVEINATTRKVSFSDGRTVSGEILMLATGVRRRELGVVGESELTGKGILRSGSRERETVKGKRVAVIGGGDAAAENALILAEYAERVYIVHRKPALAARPEFLDKVVANPKIEIIFDVVVNTFGGDEDLEWIEGRNVRSGDSFRLDVESAIVRVGVEPNSDLVLSQVECDERGYIIVDNTCLTSVDRVYAIGDVASPKSPTIASATGMGSTAAKSAFASFIK
ncbi:MAG TPA: NAD(P)/FAD-dependent oxidoreductase [Pyrinomonadaceae bacterium]|nr:NAD(P)/FAD-dependent oxidoreductase [Pyrinomonadaceae bacterium]